MDKRSLLLAVSSLSVLGAGAVQSSPPAAIVKQVQDVIDKRFADVNTSRFGITRLGEPYRTHRYQTPLHMQASNDEERAVIEQLKAGGWHVAVYTTSDPPVPGGIARRGRH